MRPSRRHFLRWTGAAACASVLNFSSLWGSDRKPNFIILFADDMGYGDAGSYGHPYIRTPNLDRMAREGVRMTSFYAASPVCSPSRAALLTGRHPLRCGVPHVYGPESQGGLPETEITLADVLRRAGYKTACVGKWHIGHSRREFMPTSRGFDTYYGLLYSNDMIKPWVQTDRPLALYQDLEPVEHPVDQNTLTKRYTEKATLFIREHRNQPFFLYLPYTMPHLPLYATEAFRDSRAGLYGAVIEEIDWSVGRILKTLQEQGLDEDTVVVFTSDNGPWDNMPPRMLAEGIQPWHAGTPGLLRGSKGTTYEGGMRVPGIFRWPGTIPAGQVNMELATTMDLFPTCLKAAGAEIPGDRVLDGKDILPMLQGAEPTPDRELYYHRGEWVEAVRKGEWKYRLSNNARAGTNQDDPVEPELYNLERDWSERYNVAAQHPELAARLDASLRAFAKEVNGRVAQ
jgi:arylsulfatase A